MAEPAYRKLTPKRRGVLRFSQAWLAQDHLLVVVSEWFSERYQRFALADIQAIVLADGPRWHVGSIVGAVASIVWLSLAMLVDSTLTKSLFAVSGAAVLGLAVRGLTRPQRCHCLLQTSVSRVPLFPVWHRGIAKEFLAAITVPIEEAQKQIPPGEPASPPPSALPVPADGESASDTGTIVSILNPRPPEIRSARNYMGESLFGALLADALMMGLILGYPKSNLTGLMATVFTAEALLAGMTLFHARSKLSMIPGLIVILCAGAILTDMFTVSGVAGVRALMAGARNQDAAVMFGSFWLSPMGTFWFAIGWRAVAGLLGLTLLIRERLTKPS